MTTTGRLARAVVAVAAIAAVPASAAAAPPWTAPVAISVPHTAIYPIGMIESKNAAAAWWRWEDGVNSPKRYGGSFVAQPDASDGFAFTSGRDRKEQVSLDVAGYGSGRLVALSQTTTHDAKGNFTSSLAVRNGGPGGFGASKTLAGGFITGTPDLGVAPDGRGLIVFTTADPTNTSRRVQVRVALRSASGQFGRPSVISGRGQADGAVVAVGRGGDMVVAFKRSRKVVARVKRPGHGWGSLQTLATPKGPTQWLLRAAVSDGGTVQVLWQRRFVSERMDGSTIQTRRMNAGAGRWSPSTTVEAKGANGPTAMLAVPGGFAVGYTAGGTDTKYPLTARVATIKGDTSGSVDVAPAAVGVRNVRLAWSARYGLFATAIVEPTIDGANNIAVGALRAPGAAGFTPAEPIAAAPSLNEIAPGFGRDGKPLAAWAAPTDAIVPGVPSEIRRVVVVTSTRPG